MKDYIKLGLYSVVITTLCAFGYRSYDGEGTRNPTQQIYDFDAPDIKEAALLLLDKRGYNTNNVWINTIPSDLVFRLITTNAQANKFEKAVIDLQHRVEQLEKKKDSK